MIGLAIFMDGLLAQAAGAEVDSEGTGEAEYSVTNYMLMKEALCYSWPAKHIPEYRRCLSINVFNALCCRYVIYRSAEIKNANKLVLKY